MHPPGKCHPSPSFQVNTQSLWHFSLPTYFHISPGGPGMGQSHFSSLTKALNPHSPWPRQVPTVPVHIALCSQPEKGGAETQILLCRGPQSSCPRGSPATNKHPRAQAGDSLQIFSLLETRNPRDGFPSPQAPRAKSGGKNQL